MIAADKKETIDIAHEMGLPAMRVVLGEAVSGSDFEALVYIAETYLDRYPEELQGHITAMSNVARIAMELDDIAES